MSSHGFENFTGYFFQLSGNMQIYSSPSPIANIKIIIFYSFNTQQLVPSI